MCFDMVIYKNRNKLYERVRQLRKNGKTFSEIIKDTGIIKSTIHEWTKDIVLSKKQIEKIKNIKPRFTEKTRIKLSEIMKSRWKSGNINLTHQRMASEVSHSKMNKDEEKFKPSLEKYLNTLNLQHKKINKSWFDYVNDKYIIEYTNDYGRGISLAIGRLKKVRKDDRIKILVCNKKQFGIIRRKRLKDIGAEFIDKDKILNTPIEKRSISQGLGP